MFQEPAGELSAGNPWQARATKEGAKRPLVNGPFIAGLLVVVLGVGQFLFFMLLDELGVVEVGNALGHGLLMVLTVPVGLLLLGLGVGIAAVRSRRAAVETGEPGPGPAR